mmetsp:Transcript_510/g.880  ORF Transcript_510/g.880 Transcript_510/m.880 type:complete len:330 (-) Transcript_510:73-1062(-)
MVKIPLFSMPMCKKYSASRFSLAYVTTLIGTAITIIVPLILSLSSSQQLKIQLKTYHEQPDIRFSYKTIVNLQAKDVNGKPNELFYSNIQQLNALRPSESFRAASVRALEVDNDRDGLNERIELIFEFPMENELVFQVQAAVFLSYKLNNRAKIHTDGLAYIQYSSGLPGSEYVSRGDVVLHQNQPMVVGDKVSEFYPTQQIMDEIGTSMSSIESEPPNIANILKRRFSMASSHDMMVDYTERFSSWKRCISCEENFTSSPKTFILSVTLDVPVLQQIVYVPTLGQTLLEIWVSYLALLTVAIFLMRRILFFIFSNQLFSSHVTIDKIS